MENSMLEYLQCSAHTIILFCTVFHGINLKKNIPVTNGKEIPTVHKTCAEYFTVLQREKKK
jgi:hypothetical protein